MITVSSFDVFDTCLTRRCAVPSALFYQIASKVFARLALPSSVTRVEDFVAARIHAEQLARQQSSREEITLVEIWRNLIVSMGWPEDDSLAQCELEVEDEQIIPVVFVRDLVQKARQQERRVIFVSDMYLPQDFIVGQLFKHGLAEPGDGFYISSEIGKTKATGSLFRHILTTENAVADQMFHTGDNRQSDYLVPRELGIRSQLYSAVNLTRAETEVMQAGGDFPSTARIAGAMRASRLDCESKGNRDVHHLASQFIAPFVMGFATWLLQRAQGAGIKRLYFVSRDCQLTWKVARELAHRFGDIDCRYLYVSRQALYLPSAKAISRQAMPWMERSFEQAALHRLLAKIDLRYDEVDMNFRSLTGGERGEYQLKSPQDWDHFWRILNEEPLRSRLLKSIATRREAAQRYFTSAGLFDDVSWALVDFGWFLTCQRSLWELLKEQGWSGKIRGYYLALRSERVGPALAGNSEALNYQSPMTFSPEFEKSGIFSEQTLLEHIVGSADHPTVHHYEEFSGVEAKPVFKNSMDDATLNFSRNVHASVLDFVAKNKPLAESFKDAAVCRNVLASLADSFFNFPSNESARALLGLSVAVDQNGLDSQPIVKPLTVGAALLPLLPMRGPVRAWWKSRNHYFAEGSKACSPVRVQQLAKLAENVARVRSKMYRTLTNWN